MKCLLLSTFEQQGGAARSAHRLYRTMSQAGVDCRMLVQYKESSDPQVISPGGYLTRLCNRVRPYLDALPLLCYRSRLSPPWSLAWLPNNIKCDLESFAPDLIHLHGVGHGFLPLSTISRLTGPIVWTLHDSWAFTGGCHLPDECERFINNCGCCPQLNGRHERDLSRWGWNRKSILWTHLDVTFVAPSYWLAHRAKSSSLLSSKNIEVIPNGIDTESFAPCDSFSARATLGISQDAIVLLYGASGFTKDANKGYDLLLRALQRVIVENPHLKLVLALFGDSKCVEIEFQGIPVRSYGHMSSENQLVNLYGAADIFILPSLQENLPNTVMEAMACGTPCVAFDVGGVSELISHGKNGYVAKSANEFELAKGISWMLENPDRCADLGHEARKTIESRFSIVHVADRYLKLYASVLAKQITLGQLL